jgi:sugar phosphate isomerase/epimerase
VHALRQRADDYGLSLEVGLGKVNPYNTAEAPAIRALGAGDYRLGMEKMIRAARAIGCTELWADTANSQTAQWGLHAIDRFRTDVTWADQLQATQRFLSTLAPLLRDLGCRIDLETHEEITTFELLALIDAIGPDVLGVTLDLANVVLRGEDPLAATRRVAPFVHLTHMRDVVLYSTPHGLARQIRACGEGIIAWHAVLSLLHPDLNLSVENASGRNESPIPIHDPRWRSGVSSDELQTLLDHAAATETRMQRGEIPDQHSYYASADSSAEEQIEFIRRCHAHLRQSR